MKIDNFWKEFGDEFDGAKIELSHEEFDVLYKVFNSLSYQSLKGIGLSDDQIKIALKFQDLY